MAKMYEFSVNLDDRYVRVVAEDKLSASKMGAQALGVVWRERARDLVIIQGREIRRKELEKVGSPSQSASLTAPPQGGAKPSAAGGGESEAGEWQRSEKSRESESPTIFPGHRNRRAKGAAAPHQEKGAASRNKSAAPTFKTGPLAGQPMKRKGR